MQKFKHFLEEELGLPDSAISLVTNHYTQKKIDKDDFLVKEGQICRSMYFIKNGYFRFFSYSDSKVITHWIFGPDQLVTDVASFYLHHPAKWNIQALTDCNVYSITDQGYKKLREQIPEWDEHEKSLLIRLMSALENRVYALISMSAEERYNYLFQSDSNMFNELPLHYLASMLGMTPETLSRVRSKSIS